MRLLAALALLAAVGAGAVERQETYRVAKPAVDAPLRPLIGIPVDQLTRKRDFQPLASWKVGSTAWAEYEVQVAAWIQLEVAFLVAYERNAQGYKTGVTKVKDYVISDRRGTKEMYGGPDCYYADVGKPVRGSFPDAIAFALFLTDEGTQRARRAWRVDGTSGRFRAITDRKVNCVLKLEG